MHDKTRILDVAKKILKDEGKDNYFINQIKLDADKEKQEFFIYSLENKILDENKIVDFLVQLNYKKFDLNLVNNASELPVLSLIKENFFKKHLFIPTFYTENKIAIVTANPLNEDLQKELKSLLGISDVEVFVASYSDIIENLKSYLDNGYGFDDFDESELDDMDVEDPTKIDDDENSSPENDAPIVKFVNKMLLDAVRISASDLHFEPYEYTYRIRFRIDGILKEISAPKINLKNQITARIKVMSGMDIAEKRKPQDGRIKIKIGRDPIDFRVNTLPTLFGEKLVLRILDSNSAKMGIDKLGYEKEQEAMFLKALEKPQGMILVTGPTGSGKTVSLYTGLNILNDSETNISTAEDPVEINLTGINQVNINNRAGMDFASALRAFLRQDPDIIMVGEIRDLETAEISIKAAQTGHMVMSTLHTNNAAETITRLRNMGVPSYNVATSVNLIIAQRLVRRLCGECKVPLDIPKDALRELGFKEEDLKDSFTVYEPSESGCPKCSNGYKGRAGVYEVVEITKPISSLILNDADSLTINQKMREEGYIDLRQAALLKVKAGLTSLAEVSRVTIE